MRRALFGGVVGASIIANGLVGGTFLTFSAFVMPALARLAPVQGMAAMQAINVAVVPSAFMAVFLLSALLNAALAAAPFWFGRSRATSIACAAGVIGLAGSFGVTMVCNVPLNERLAAATADAGLWADYLGRWTWWNMVRCVAATIAAALPLIGGRR